MRHAQPASTPARQWTIGRVAGASLALLCLLASPARAQDAGVSGIPSGPGNVNGLNGSVRDPSGIGNAARIPALPQPSMAPVPVPSVAPSAGYRSSSPAVSYRELPARRAAKGKRTRFATTKSRRGAAKAQVSDEDKAIDRKVISICRGC
jgi:hypothetical protein